MTYTFSNVTSSRTITATFEEETFETIAIYSADDTSLTFLKTSGEITVGDTYNEKTVTAVYTGIETTNYSSSTKPGWISSYASSITNVTFEDTITPISTAYWFNGCSSLTVINNINKLNTSNVTNMEWMFFKCSGLSSLDVSGFSTANVTNMNRMFSGCSSLSSLDVSGFNTANVINMELMFNECRSLSSLDLS